MMVDLQNIAKRGNYINWTQYLSQYIYVYYLYLLSAVTFQSHFDQGNAIIPKEVNLLIVFIG